MRKKLITSLDDLEMLGEKNSQTDILGFGALSQVRKVRLRSNGKIYALKEMNLNMIHQNDIKNIQREVEFQLHLDHPNIIHLYDSMTTPNNMMYLLLEYAEKNNLFHFIQKTPIDEKTIHRMFFQTVQGIEYIHKKKIMHRDLKPENILLDANFNAKICDFGWCAECNEYERRQTFCGTNEYMAPEILNQQKQDFMIDIWALGILLYEMYHKRAPFTGRNPKDIFKSIFRRQIAFKAIPMCAEAKDMIDKILQIDPRRRPTIEQIFGHPYFNKFPFFRIDNPDTSQSNQKASRRSYVVGGNELNFGDNKKVMPEPNPMERTISNQEPRFALQQTMSSSPFAQQGVLLQSTMAPLTFKKENSAPTPIMGAHQPLLQKQWMPQQPTISTSPSISQLPAQSYQPVESMQPQISVQSLHTSTFAPHTPVSQPLTTYQNFSGTQNSYAPQPVVHASKEQTGLSGSLSQETSGYLASLNSSYIKSQPEEMKVTRTGPTGPLVISSNTRKEYGESAGSDLQRVARGSYELGSANIRPQQSAGVLQYAPKPDPVYPPSYGSLPLTRHPGSDSILAEQVVHRRRKEHELQRNIFGAAERVQPSASAGRQVLYEV